MCFVESLPGPRRCTRKKLTRNQHPGDRHSEKASGAERTEQSYRPATIMQSACCDSTPARRRENPGKQSRSLTGFSLKSSLPDSTHPKETLTPVTQLHAMLPKLSAEPGWPSTPHVTTDNSGTRKNTRGEAVTPPWFPIRLSLCSWAQESIKEPTTTPSPQSLSALSTSRR